MGGRFRLLVFVIGTKVAIGCSSGLLGIAYLGAGQGTAANARFLCGKTDFPVLFADSDGEQQCAFIAFCLKRPGGDGKMTKRLFFKWKVGTFRFFLSNFVT